MASTITLQNVVNVSQIFLRNLPLGSLNGVVNEPALTIANMTAAIILAPPLSWPWNSAISTTTTLTVGTPTVTVSLPSFGWLQTASVTLGGVTTQLTIKDDLGESSQQQLPTFISVKGQDGLGNVTFRMMGVPDQAYTLNLDYQQAPPLFTTLSQTWSPIPDSLSHIYQLGFRAFAYEIDADPRWQATMQLFLSQLLNAHGGLSEQQKNLFLQNYAAFARVPQTQTRR